LISRITIFTSEM